MVWGAFFCCWVESITTPGRQDVTKFERHQWVNLLNITNKAPRTSPGKWILQWAYSCEEFVFLLAQFSYWVSLNCFWTLISCLYPAHTAKAFDISCYFAALPLWLRCEVKSKFRWSQRKRSSWLYWNCNFTHYVQWILSLKSQTPGGCFGLLFSLFSGWADGSCSSSRKQISQLCRATQLNTSIRKGICKMKVILLHRKK